MNHELNKIAKRHKGHGMLEKPQKKSFDERMSDYGLEFWLIVVVAFCGFIAVLTLSQALRILIGG